MFKKYPYTKQHDNKDCGVACLQMIIKNYKGYVSIEELRNMSKTNQKGTSAFHIVETAKNLGFEAYGVKCDLPDLNKNNLFLPCIAHINLDNKYNHYVVIYEVNFKKKYFMIADPASKIYKISFADFNKIWNKILILLYPIKTIAFNKSNMTITKFIKNIFDKSNKTLKIIILLSLIVTLTSILTSLYFKFMTDTLISHKPQNKMVLIFIIFILLTFIKLVTTFLRNKLLIYYDKIISSDLSNNIFKQIISLPYHYYTNRTPGEIVSYYENATNIKDIIIRLVITLFIDIPLSLISFIIIFFINKDISIIIFIVMIINIIKILLLKKILTNQTLKLQKSRVEMMSYLVEGITGFETIKGINLKNQIIDKFEKKYFLFSKQLLKMDLLSNRNYIFKDSLKNISELLIIFIGCIFIIENKITIGSLIAINSLINYFFIPFDSLSDLLIQIEDTKISLKRIIDLFYYQTKKIEFDNIPRGDIIIKNLNYSYDDVNLILKNIDLKIKENAKVMIMGKSGCGKSTLLKILMKYYQIKRDSITVNGIDINDYNYDIYSNYLSYISQNEFIFNDTLLNNLNITENKNNPLELANMCFVNEIIKNSNLGYNSLIEENGFNISGGERQRIILARTLLKDFNILLIDEGLSEMDINLERKILKNIFSKFKNKTIIITSHRKDNMDLFDKVINIDNGKIKEVLKKHG